jgi:hypothetical protein
MLQIILAKHNRELSARNRKLEATQLSNPVNLIFSLMNHTLVNISLFMLKQHITIGKIRITFLSLIPPTETGWDTFMVT